MAKLKARGRIEFFRVEKEQDLAPSDASGMIWKKESRALMSDGNILERLTGKWPDRYSPGGVRHHDWGWKVRGKIKAGSTPQKLLDLYLSKGFALKNKAGYGVEWDAPLITEKKAAQAKQAKAKGAEKRKAIAASKSGPGFYVTNGYTQGLSGRIADHERPFATFEGAEEAAWKRLQHLSEMSFYYLLPVQVIEARSRREAEHGIGHVWWTDGKMKGPPVDPRQLRFAQVNGGR